MKMKAINTVYHPKGIASPGDVFECPDDRVEAILELRAAALVEEPEAPKQAEAPWSGDDPAKKEAAEKEAAEKAAAEKAAAEKAAAEKAAAEKKAAEKKAAEKAAKADRDDDI